MVGSVEVERPASPAVMVRSERHRQQQGRAGFSAGRRIFSRRHFARVFYAVSTSSHYADASHPQQTWMDVQARRRPILPGARRGSRKKVSSASRSLISLEYRYDPSADDDVLKTEEG